MDCLVHPDDDHEADRERGWLCCGPAWRRMVGDLAAIPEVWLQLWSLGVVERDVRAGTRAVRRPTGELARVPFVADPVANVFTAGPMGSGWRESRIRSTRPERVPVNLDVMDVTGGVNHAARRLHVRAVLGLEPDQEGHLSAATVLHRWVLRWAARRREGEPRRTVGAMAGWLRDRLHWACAHDELLGEFAEEIAELRRVLDGLAGNFAAPPERVDRPCPACGWWALAHDRAAELIRCGNCGRALTEDEYADHLRELIAVRWKRAAEHPAPVGVPLWVRDDVAGRVWLGLADGVHWRSWSGQVLVEVSYWAPVVEPADPGPAREGPAEESAFPASGQ